jgi:hypothetical protein
MEEAEHVIKSNQKAFVYPSYPNATGNTAKPKEVFPEE